MYATKARYPDGVFRFDSFQATLVARAGKQESAAGRPATASGQAHAYGFPSTSRALPIHERPKRKYPNPNSHPFSAAVFHDGVLAKRIYRPLNPTNNNDQAVAGAMASALTLPNKKQETY